ncbi:apolipoprotein N-acyltransferase [Pseudonocardia sediminis]|uniref:Apolipoprotein N-acyltransferase n=1 Tax=Pseudonocardia sediminis TaxID=1397368 RepID=A0A4Q7UXD9_PSEST|nr:apolipoprotein N-acyltransferase [Pseudonocardia sediminis]RZT85601.1 apolipoprotein N-acyltransferase [Pseudonocardia sediminis]
MRSTTARGTAGTAIGGRAATAAATATAGAAGGGLLLFLSFPPRGWWWLAPVAFVVIGAAWRGRGARAGAGLGMVTGVAFFVPLLSWTGEFVGPVPWLALATLQALFVALAGAAVGALPDRWWWPVGAAAVWVAAEAPRGRVPFDGFPWGRTGFSQPEGVFTPVAALGGVALLGFVVALTGFALPGLARAVLRADTRLPAAAVLLVPIVITVVAPVVAVTTPPGTASVVVAAVQGNVPRAGLDFNAQRRTVLDNHARRTEKLAADVAAGRVPRPDLVLWPENSADVDPLRSPDARAAVDRAVRAIGVPVLVGAVLNPPDGPPTNTMVAWSPESGPGEIHDKRRLQPFGEYMPYKDFFRLFSPLVDRSSDFVPGSGDGVVPMAGVAVGIATCYEVIFDDLVRDSVRSGAQMLAVPSNNATFGRTGMTYQQLAIDRVRSVEFGRSTVVPTTSGVSAVILPDGTVRSGTAMFEPAALVERVPLRSDLTPALRYGAVAEWVLVATAVLAVAGAVLRRQRR